MVVTLYSCASFKLRQKLSQRERVRVQEIAWRSLTRVHIRKGSKGAFCQVLSVLPTSSTSLASQCLAVVSTLIFLNKCHGFHQCHLSTVPVETELYDLLGVAPTASEGESRVPSMTTVSERSLSGYR